MSFRPLTTAWTSIVFAARLQPHFVPAGDFQIVHVLGSDFRAIDPERHRGRVGIDFHRSDGVFAIHMTARRDVKHGFLGPVRLVEEEGVLARLAVVADEALVVDAGGVAFVAPVAGEVEHVPDERAPAGRVIADRPVVSLMHDGLPFLGMPAAGGDALGRVLLVLADGSAGTVFAHADAAVLAEPVVFLQHLGHAVGVSLIPAGVGVERDEVGDVGEADAVRLVGGTRGETGGILLLGECVEFLEQHLEIRRRAMIHLVEKTPAEDRRMVAMLRDHFAQLALRVLREGGIVAGAIHVRHLGPDEQARLVAQRVKLPGMRVMREPHAASADFPDEPHVLGVILALTAQPLPARS